ncbi:MAG: glycosyltransferase family 1 protein [Bacteroidetes bacterium]|nr:glycosyltransferase family 1 protein [Bacteroidota bacterium]
MLKIGIEAQRIFRKKKHGMDMVALELIRNLQLIDKENQYFIYVKDDEDNQVLKPTDNFKIIKIPSTPYPYWEQVLLPEYANKNNIDILHCTSNTAPLKLNSKLVLTLHDIIYLEKLNFTKGTPYQIAGNFYRRWNVPKVVKKASKIITVSDFEKHAIQSHFGYNNEKVNTIYNGVGKHFTRIVDKTVLDNIKRKYSLPDKYIFYLGNTDPKKNVAGVLKALSILKKKANLHCKLLMLDIDRNFLQQQLNNINDLSLMDDLVFCGYVPNHDLPAIYSQADAFLYPSLRESFGIPILEAMACGVPVITSNTSSMPEIANDAALYCNPFDPESIASSINQLVSDNQLKLDLIEKGLNRVNLFSWENNAKQTMDIYNKVC